MPNPVVAVVILNYNGKEFLTRFLPSVTEYSKGNFIYVADNNSTDDSVQFLIAEYPHVKIIRMAANNGFACGYNEALKQVEADYFVLLNSDVEVSPGWLDPIIGAMERDKELAAVQPKVLAWAEKNKFEYAGASGGFIAKYGYPFCRGRLFNTLETDNGQYDTRTEIFWATGACLFIRAVVFKEMGGFDPLYFAHMEEIDLCWRMKNRGYKIMVEPASVVHHLGAGTLKKISPRKTFLNFRNNLITFTKNYPKKNLLFIILYRLFLDGVAGLKFLMEGRPGHTWAVIRAHYSFFWHLPHAIKERSVIRSHPDHKPSMKGVFKENIVFHYFFKKHHTFSELPQDRFY